jgi:hypothetical protein
MRKLLLTLILGVLGLAVLLPATAMAEEEEHGEIESFATTTSTTQAGGHPNVRLEMKFKEYGFGEGTHDPRQITTHLPAGMIGNPHAIPICSLVAFSAEECPPSSQVGIAGVYAFFGLFFAPLYNLETKPGQAGLLGFDFQESGTVQFIEVSSRTNSDYGLDSISTPIYHAFGLKELILELWGVPAEPVHDAMRAKPPVVEDCKNDHECAFGGASAGVAPQPFMSNPTTCGAPLEASIDVEFYDQFIGHAATPWPTTTGCSQLAFNPSLTVKPTTTDGDSASGLDADLQVPQISNPTTPSPSEIRAATVTLPPGVSINPNAADGKTACAETQTAIGTLGPATCPEYSKVGTLSIDSSALPGSVPGAIYLAEPKPGDPYRLLLAADGFGTHIKLLGSARTDPVTGQIVVAFENLPQSPLTDFDMHFFGSERGLLATPTQCGTYPVEAEFRPWDDALANQSSTSFFEVTSGPGGSPCPDGPRRLAPRFSAGSANSTAGRHSAFSLEVVRGDGEQNLSALTVSTPPGFSGTLKGIPYCSESAIAAIGGTSGLSELAAPSCPAASQVGTATIGAGAGDHPLYVEGKVYLAGPYKGAPLSLVTVVPAVSGPYDLGNVAVRAALQVNPATAQVTAVSDSLPQIMGGIPLRVRSIRIDLNRPEFALNPTNCEPFATTGTIAGSEGAAAPVSSHFQAGNCANLEFGPKLSLKLTGGTNRRGHPAIQATVTAKPGEANIKRAAVALPKGELLDNAHIGTVCTRPQFAAQACPARSLLGTAEAVTPLLDTPLKGNVYLRSNPAHKLPDIVADLRGQIDIELAGKIDTVNHGALRTTFEGVPDAPVTKFTLNLAGGKKGLLQNETSLCKAAKKAEVKMTGQNGAVVASKVKLQAACGKKKGAGKKPAHRAGKGAGK